MTTTCAVPMPDRPDEICGMPVEDEPCTQHLESRQVTKDNIRELYGWIDAGELRHAAGVTVDGLVIYRPGMREVALFGDLVVREPDGFHVYKSVEVR